MELHGLRVSFFFFFLHSGLNRRKTYLTFTRAFHKLLLSGNIIIALSFLVCGAAMERTFLKFRQGFLNTQTQLLYNFARIKLSGIQASHKIRKK